MQDGGRRFFGAMVSNRFLFVVPRFHTNLFFATKALVEAGHEVEVFAPKREPTEDYRYVTPKIFGRTDKPAALRRAIRAFAPDLVFLRNARPASLWVENMGRFGRLPMLRYNQKAMTNVLGFGERVALRLQGLPVRRVTPKPGVDRAAPVDPYADYLPWPVERDVSVLPQRRATGPLRVVCVAKLMQRRKNQDKLIAATAQAVRDGRITLTFVGSTLGTVSGADATHLEALRRAAGQSDGAIRIIEDLGFEQMGEVYAAHDVCVLPSTRELLGTAPIEAMAYGCVPVIAARCGSAGYLTDGEDGFVVDMDQPDRLRDTLDRLADDPALLDRVGVAARHTAETELGPRRFVERVEEILARVSKRAI